MKWIDDYDCPEILNDKDKYGNILERGNKVIFASCTTANRPYLNEGIVLGFLKSPSFINVVVKTVKNHIVKKSGNILVKIS